MTKGKMLPLLTGLALLTMPLHAGAMDHGAGGHGGHGTAQAAPAGASGHDGHAAMNHGSASAGLGKMAVKGITASAEISDVRAAMQKAGQPTTHHLMISFTGADGAAVSQGTAAVKVIGPDGVAGTPIRMMLMDGSFGADLTLAQPGVYQLEVGSKLADGVTRQFAFQHAVK